MIVWYLLLTTTSSALLVHGSSVFTSAQEQNVFNQWQTNMERLRSQMQDWFQNVFNDYQRRVMTNPFGGAFNFSSMMDLMPGPSQPGGAQSNLSATVERSGQTKGQYFDSPANRPPTENSPDDGNASLSPLPGQSPLSQLRGRAHLAAQFRVNREMPGDQDGPRQFQPSQSSPSLFPNGPYWTGRPGSGRRPPISFPPGQRRLPEGSSEESRESQEYFFPGRGQGRPSGFPGRRMPGWNRGRGNGRLPDGSPPGQDSWEESRRGQNSENMRGRGRNGQFSRGFSLSSQFPRPRGTPGLFPPGQPYQAQPTGVPSGFGDYRPDNIRRRQRARPTPFEQITVSESFQGQQQEAQGPSGQSSSRQESSRQADTWPSLFIPGLGIPIPAARGIPTMQNTSGGTFSGQYPPAVQ